MSQQGKMKTKSLLDFSIHNKNFSCMLYAHSQFLSSSAKFDLANWGVRQPVKPHTFLCLLDCSYSTRHQRSLILPL